MAVETDFADLITRARGGCQRAAAEIVRLYEPGLVRTIRAKMTDPNLRRVVDPADISQSVFSAFFVRLAAGQFELLGPTDLLRLLTTMARNKVFDHARGPWVRRSVGAGAATFDHVADDFETPSSFVSLRELIAEARRRLTPEELGLAEQRKAGRSWDEIAAAAGTTPGAVRKRFGRALDRVCRELGIPARPDEA